DDSLSGLVSDYNVVGSLYQSEDSGATQSLAQWRTSTGADTNSFVNTPQDLFVDPGNGDYHLLPTGPAVDSGVGAADDAVAPPTDAEGNPRPEGLAWDIGAYEVSSTPDTTPPILSNITSQNIKPNRATISWTTDEAANAMVQYGPTTDYGSSIFDDSLLSTHSLPLPNLDPSTTYHFQVKSADSSGNLSVSGDFTFTTLPPDVTPPVISPPTVSNLAPGSATLGWTTDEPSNSQIAYGFSSSHGNTSALDTSLVTSHGVQLTSLIPSTVYHFSMLSRDEFGNLATSADFTFTTPGPGGLPPGTLAYWTFSESGGTTAADSSGNGHTGTLLNGASFTSSGFAGNGIQLDGVDDQVRIPRADDLEPAQISLAAWIFLPPGVEADWATIIKKTYADDTDPVYGSYSIQISPDGDANILGFFTGNFDGGDELNSPMQVPTGQWVHVAATYDPVAGEKKLFMNGALVASESGLTEPLVYDTTSSGDLYMAQDPGPGEAFEGTLDNVGIWGRILSPDEIASMAYPLSASAVSGTTGNDTILITRVDPQTLQVQVNHNAPTSVDLTRINHLDIDGGTGTDRVAFSGSADSEDIAIDGSNIRVGSLLITRTSVEKVTFDGGGGADILSLNSTTVQLQADQSLAALNISSGAALDLTDRTLLLDYGPGNPSPIAAITGMLRSGWNNGAWNGPGIISTLGDATQHAIGSSDNPAAGQIKLTYTRYGDADLNGIVDVNDLSILAMHWHQPGLSFGVGDFNYDGLVDEQDLGLLSLNWQQGGATPGSLAAQFGLPLNPPTKQIQRPRRFAAEVLP
ncbi:MAG TPA: LamG-like jellyroll fold domain-containing protein, partial [Tepidisphaeraceae bacterium]